MASHTRRAPSRNRCQVIQLGRIDEQRGTLCVAEVGEHIPFDVQRAYWVFDVPRGGERARHAHREQYEILIAIRGGFTVYCNDGDRHSVYELDSPDTGLLLSPMVFHYLDDFTLDAMCLVLASGPFDCSEYVHDYEEFCQLARGR